VLGKQPELDINDEDVPDLVGIEAEKLSIEELIKLEGQRNKEVDAEEVTHEAPRKVTGNRGLCYYQ